MEFVTLSPKLYKYIKRKLSATVVYMDEKC